MKPIREIHNLESLEEGDWIAFPYAYFAGDTKHIMVTNITSCWHDKKQFLVHFLWGHHSCGEWINYDDVVAIGCTNGDTKIKGWDGGK